MELRVLQYFLAVAREGSITRAAQSLHLTQPTLSRQLAQLEDELGTALFRRGSRTVELTEEGLLLKSRAQELLDLADKTRQDLRSGRGALSGTVSIGSGEFAASRILAAMMTAFRRQNPQVDFEIYSGNSNNVRDYIDRGLLDLGLVMEPVDLQRYDFLLFPVQEQGALLVREDDPLARLPYVTPGDLAGRTLILASSDRATEVMLRWLGRARRSVQIAVKGNLLYNNAMTVQQGMGVALTSYFHCHYDGLRYLPLRPVISTGTALAWKKDQAHSPAAAAFLKFAAEYLKGMDENAEQAFDKSGE